MALLPRRVPPATTALALVSVSVALWAGGLEGQEAGHALQGYSRVERIPAIGTVADFEAIVGRRKVNPFRYDCVANLEVVDASGTQVSLADDLQPSQVKILPDGEARNARTAEVVALRDDNRRIVVKLSMDGDPDRVAFRVEGARLRSPGTGEALPDLQSGELDIPDEIRRRCGSAPRFNLDLQDPTTGADGLAVNADVVKRHAFDGAGGGLWEFSLSGAALSGDSAVTLDSWRGGADVQWNLSPWPDHWIGLGLSGKLAASENLETVDGSVGATLKVRLDFLGLDELLAPLVSRFTPYPFLVAEYNFTNDVRTPALESAPGPASRDVNNRLDMRIDWRVPFLFDTTVDLELSGTYLLGDLPAGEAERWRTLTDISVEYPLSSAGDVVAVLTRLSGETAPLFTEVSRLFLGIGIRR